MRGLRLALGFLTAIPVRAAAQSPGDLGRAAAWFPAVGLLLGAALAGAAWTLGLIFPPPLTAALVVVLWAALTGGLHLDGLADCGDGLFAAVSRERRLEIMRDSRMGAFGAISLILFLILKVVGVASLPSEFTTPFYGFRFSQYALLLAPALSRWLILFVAKQPGARADGLGAAFAAGLTPAPILIAAILPAALVALGGWRGVGAAVAAAAAAAAAAAFARARLGGVTGDVLGLTVEVCELAALLAVVAGVK